MNFQRGGESPRRRVGMAMALAVMTEDGGTGVRAPSRRGVAMVALAAAALALVLSGVWMTSAQAEGHPQEGTWSPGGRLRQLRTQEHTATRLPDGRVLLVGGSSAELWDPNTRESRLTNPPQTSRKDHTATLLNNGHVLVVGGFDSNSFSLNSAAEIYNPDTEQWTPVASMKYERHEHSATLLADGRVLVVGGEVLPPAAEPDSGSSDLTPVTARLGRFQFTVAETDLAAGETVTINLDAAQVGGAHYSSDDDHYSSFHGEVTATTSLDTAQLTFTATEAIEAGTTVTVRVNSNGIATEWVAERHAVVFARSDGGTARTTLTIGPRAMGTAEIYDPGQNEWTTVETPDQARRFPVATRLTDGRVLVTGGYGNPVQPTHDEGSPDITDVTGERINSRFASSQDFAFAIVERDLPSGSQVTINLDDAQAGHPSYADDDSLWTSEHGDVTVSVGPNTAELTFTAADGIPAGTRVTVIGGRGAVATDSDVAEWYDVEFTRTDGGSQTTSFLMGPTAHDSAEIFDPGSDPAPGTWEPATSMQAARGSAHAPEHAARLLGNGTVLVVGGHGEGPPAEFYHPGGNEWQPCDSAAPDVPDCPVYPDIRRPISSVLNDGTVLIAGYSSGPKAQRFAPEDGEWWAADDPQGNVFGHPTAVLDNGHVFVAVTREAEVYSPQTVPAPVLKSVSPERGPANGGYEMTITGQNLADPIFVSFGDLDRRVGEVTEVSPNEIRVVAPTHPAEWASVRVATPGGMTEIDPTQQVEFVANDGTWAPTPGDDPGSGGAPVVLDGPSCQDTASTPDYCGRVLFAGSSSSQLFDPDTGRFGSAASIPVSDGLGNPFKRITQLNGPVCRGEEPPDYCGNVVALAKSDPDTGEFVAEMALYDPATNEWQGCAQESADFECPPTLEREDAEDVQWEATTLLDGHECHDPQGPTPDHCGKVLAATKSPFGRDQPPPEMWLYDPATGQWSQAASPSETRGKYVMTLVEGAVCEGDAPPGACGDVLLASGVDDIPGMGVRTLTAELYDPDTGQWRETADSPPPGLAQPTATTLPDGRIVVAGGHLEPHGPQGDASIFDPRDESWRPLPDIPDDRNGHGAVVLPDGRLMLAGGEVRTPGGTEHNSRSVLVFDPQAGTEGQWSYTDSMLDGREGPGPQARLAFPLVPLPDGRVLATGGGSGSAELFSLNPGSVVGRVLDAGTGAPVEGAAVSVTDADGAEVSTATTNAEGTYQANDVPFGDYTVTAAAAGYQTASEEGVTVNAGEPKAVFFELAQSPTSGGGGGGGTGGDGSDTGGDTGDSGAVTDPEDGLVVGTVTDADDGQALGGVAVTATGPDTASTATGADGGYELAGLTPGSYTITADTAGYEAASTSVEVAEGQAVQADFALQPEAGAAGNGSVEGTVTDAATAAPVVGAQVTVADDAGNEVVTAGSDEDGNYWVRNLPPGAYTLTATADGYAPDRQDVTVEGGQIATVDFALSPDDAGAQPEEEALTVACPEGEVPTASFTDRDAIPDAHRSNVDCAAWRDIVSGFADGTFGPARPVRRDQMATFIAGMLDAADVALPAPREERFDDVAAGSAHDEAVHRLAAAEIVQGGPLGMDASSYGPSLRVRRDQMGSFLLRAAAFATGEDLASQDQAFDDVPAGNTHFANVNGAAEAGFARGFGDGTYRPAGEVRRDQMATFVVRVLDHVLRHEAGGAG